MTARPDDLALHRVDLDDAPWDEIEGGASRASQTRAWLEFIRTTQGAEPVVARVVDRSGPIGWFTGAVARRGGVRQLGSPLPGWTTSAMGCSTARDVPTAAVLGALETFAFEDLGCWHLEVADPQAPPDLVVPDGVHRTDLNGYRLDLADDDEMLAAMTANGRRDVRRALRNDITVETVDPSDLGGFVAESMTYLAAAFASRGHRPTYGPERLQALIDHLGPTGRLLLLRVRDAHGTSIGTSITVGQPGGLAELWSAACDRDQHRSLPNEALTWHALTHWRDQGATAYEFGGGAHKRKFGGQPSCQPWLRTSRSPLLERARAVAVRARTTGRRWAARRRRATSP